MGFFQKIIDDFGLGQHKVDEEALYAQIALFKDDLKAQEGKYTNQDEAIQFRDKWADLYKEAKAARLGKKSPLWEERKQFTDTFDRLAEVLTGYNSAVIAAESKRCDALLSDIDGKNLDPQQRAVVLCNEKRMLVLAGAGSGKTLTIAGKVKYLCQEKGVSPEDILLIAFTHKSAEEMTDRISGKLGIPVSATTFHKLGLDLIREAEGKRPDVYQLKKSLVSPKSLDYPISFFCYDIAPFQMLRKAIDKIISEFGKDSSILILGRNKFDFEILIGSQLFQWHRDGTLMYWDSPETPIRFLTAHKSKGLEADNVILLNFQNSTLGFPNKIADDPVLALVLAEPEDFLYAEERRLLYVALTRTKNRVFVLTDSRKPSEFFKEFKPSKSVFILNKETDIADLPCCPKCRTGHLLSRRNERTGKFFVGCSNYPKCDYVVRDVTVLTEQKVCPQCGGFLVRRRGQYGEFYGCTNYPRCSYTEQISVEKKTGN